jgi:hypothetical protein
MKLLKALRAKEWPSARAFRLNHRESTLAPWRLGGSKPPSRTQGLRGEPFFFFL